MDTGKTAKRIRRNFVTANKYQEEIILLAFIPTALIFLTFICIVFMAPPILKVLFHSLFLNPKISVYLLPGIIAFFMCSFFISSLIGAFIISHHLVGAFGRIVRELDDIIAQRSQMIIKSRPGDQLSDDLLKRINVLIEYYVQEHKKKVS